MKLIVVAALSTISVLSACGSAPTVPVGMKAGAFVSYQCDGGKRLQARLADDGSTVRVRHDGGYELDRKGDGVFEGEGFKLVAASNGALELMHHGKPTARNCKSA